MMHAVTMRARLKAHLWTLPRWFAITAFGGPALLGALLAGGITANSWLGFVAVLLVMAGGHSFNSFLDYAWTGLDKGEETARSAEKDYTGGQSLLATGVVGQREVAFNAIGWYLLSLVPLIYLAVSVGWQILIIGLLGMAVTFWYAKAKFNWMHEIALGFGVGPLPLLAGMFATSSNPPWVTGLVASVPFVIMSSFGFLALDEWPDAEANLKKGVKSVAYKVWETGVSLEWYLTSWYLFMYLYQIFLIAAGILAPLSAISFFTWPPLLASMVFLKGNFRKAAGITTLVITMYPVLLVIGQFLGS